MKRKTIILTAIIAIALLCLTFSCKEKKQTLSGNEITFDSLLFSEKIPLLEKIDSLLPYADLEIRFTYPAEFRSKEDLSRLQQIFIGTFFSDIYLDSLSPEEAMESYIEEYKEDYKSLSNDYYSEMSMLEDEHTPMWYWYSQNLSNKIQYQNDKLLSYSREFYEYTGGAHGSYMILHTNIDLNKLVTLSEEDVFVPGYQKPLAEIIVKRLMIQNDVTDHEGLISIGFFDIDEIFPNNNFRLSNKGVYYSYNQYEIAPYVMGVIDVFIPYEDLEDLLQEDVIEKYIAE